ncbi:hypothetical protein [Demequina sp.]|uniref:hypothetical protein n=1 Tax=Demequina sp. TaxID=2050685 RepID=UPI0025BDE497|nr:hypothetical protein [Demequina sp.]
MTRNKWSLVVASPPLLLATAVGLVLTGCSSTSSGDSNSPPSLEQIAANARAGGHDWQADLLDDGDITPAEYDEGHRRNLACLDAAGITYSDPERNLPDGFRWLYDMFWPGLSDSEGQRVSQDCYDQNLGDLELAMSAWGDWSTEPALLADIVDCVNNQGFSIDADVKNWNQVWLSGADQGLTQQAVAMCAQNGMARLHPGVGYAL